MAYLFGKEILFAVIAWVVFVQTRFWLRWRNLRKWGAEQGAVDVPNLPNKLPGGIERYKILIELLTGRLKNFDFLEDLVRKRHLDLGRETFRINNAFNESMVTTSDPENIQALLATKFHDFDLGPERRDSLEELLGHGIFTAERESWAHFRHQLRPQFSRDQVSDLESTQRHLDVLLKVLPEENEEGWIEEVDLLPMLYRLTMDLSTEFLFGQSVDSQSHALYSQESGNTASMQEQIAFSDAMGVGTENIALRFRLRFLYRFISHTKFRQACRTVQNFTGRFVDLALAKEKDTMRGTNATGKPKFTLLNELVKETQNPVELTGQVLNVLAAGRDTTSAAIAWAILSLSRHPEEFSKLRAAILAHFGTLSYPTNELTFESLKSCKPLTHVIYETLRLYPLVPVNGRVALRDTILPVGGGKDGRSPVTVMKGENVGFSTYVLHRREDIWGVDAGTFRSNRWEGRKLGWEFVPFSGGPRICLGQQYAMNNMAFVIAKFVQRYDKIEALDMSPPKKGLSLVLAPGDGVKVKMHRAND